METSFVVSFAEVSIEDIATVGGKNASLGELTRTLSRLGVRVPAGFAVTADAFRLHLSESGLEEEVYGTLDRTDVSDVAALATAGQRVRGLIRDAPLPAAVSEAVLAAYRDLSRESDEEATDVAVRSSATAEDLPTASFAGQQESYLNVRGDTNLLDAVRDCMASLFTDRAIAYRSGRGFEHRKVALSVGVQKMVRSDLASAGVIFTLDTETGFRDVVLVTGAWGLGESLVQGRVDPDEFWVHKPTLREGFRPILRRECGEKAIKLMYGDGPRGATREVRVPRDARRRLVLTDDEVLELARSAVSIEEHYSRAHGRPTPMDLEWAKDGRTGHLYIVQARPETVHAQRKAPVFESFRLRGDGELLVTGKNVGNKIAAGPVRIVRTKEELAEFQPGEVLVATMTDPDWEPVLRRAAAVVTDHGGRTCHAAIVARELGLPCVVGTGTATATLRTGQEVTVSASDGSEGRIYAGRLDFERTEIDLDALAKPAVPLLMNLANPDLAFSLSAMPSGGVGLLRVEFLVSKWIGIHPMALVHPERVESAAERAEILRRTEGLSAPADLFVDRMASGVGVIAAAFHPRPVIARLSDFKTNEYADLLGGRAFEPDESNPMIGFRGASRYYDERYREGFALECAALRRVRDEMGLRNLKIMVPFCRTLDEGRRVLAEMKGHGLERGENGLEVYVMCEIPNNVVLATEFSELFDGFSIGSNDLTQLTLGVDRDSELLAHVFDEQDPGVKRMIESVVADAHRAGRKVGICGQAPSDHPEFAEFLVSIGIDTISLTPDALPEVARRLGAGR